MCSTMTQLHLKNKLLFQQTGFTLPELLVAALITSLVMTTAGVGLVQILRANQKSATEQERQSELNRALDFMADDIKAAKFVELDPDPKYLFKLTKPDNSKIVYYTVPKSANPRWRGPRIVYRKQIAPSIKNAEALIDAIANVDPSCPASGGNSAGNQGLKVFIQDKAYMKLCLVGQLNDSRTLLLEKRAFTRGS